MTPDIFLIAIMALGFFVFLYWVVALLLKIQKIRRVDTKTEDRDQNWEWLDK